MSEPSCGRNCGGCRKCDITAGKSLSERQRQTEATANGLNAIARQRRERLIRERPGFTKP